MFRYKFNAPWAGKLEFRDVIPNISYTQPFIRVKKTSSKTMRFATIVNIDKGNEHVIKRKKKNFIHVVKEFNYMQTLKSSKQKGN